MELDTRFSTKKCHMEMFIDIYHIHLFCPILFLIVNEYSREKHVTAEQCTIQKNNSSQHVYACPTTGTVSPSELDVVISVL